MGNEKIIRNGKNCEVLVSREEEKYRKKFPSFEETKDKQFKCTVCCVNLTPFIVSGKSCHLHSFLKVLVCKKCMEFYGNGDFSTDEDGDEKYCRWCGQGGNLFLCEKCNSGFCKACVKRNFTRAVFEDLKKQDNWNCYLCDPKPMFELRAKAWVAEKHFLSNRKEDKKSKTKAINPDDETTKEKRKEDASVKSEQKVIDAARKLMLDSLDDVKQLADECKSQAEKIQKTKLPKKHVKDVENVKNLDAKLQVFFGSITENVGIIKANLEKNMVDWQQHYDESFKNQTNGVKVEENGRDDVTVEKEEEEEEEEEEKTGAEEDGDEGDNKKKEDNDKKDNVENGDDVPAKDDEGDIVVEKEEEEEKKEESMEVSLDESANADPEATQVDECDATDECDVTGANSTVCSDKLDNTNAADSDENDEPAAKIRKK